MTMRTGVKCRLRSLQSRDERHGGTQARLRHHLDTAIIEVRQGLRLHPQMEVLDTQQHLHLLLRHQGLASPPLVLHQKEFVNELVRTPLYPYFHVMRKEKKKITGTSMMKIHCHHHLQREGDHL